MPQDVYGLPSDNLLTNISIAQRNEASGFVANIIAPKVPVKLRHGFYQKWTDKNSMSTQDGNVIPPNGVAREIEISADTDAYHTVRHGSRIKWSQDDMDEYAGRGGSIRELKKEHTLALTDADMLSQEERAVALYNDVAQYATGFNDDLTGAEWGGTAADFLANIESAKKAIHKATGKEPNSMVIGYETKSVLSLNEELKFLYQQANKLTGITQMTMQAISELIGLQIYVSNTRSIAGNPGQPAQDPDYLWGKNALIFYTEPQLRRRSMSFAKDFTKADFRFRTYKENKTQFNWIVNEHEHAPKIVAQKCGFLYQNVIA